MKIYKLVIAYNEKEEEMEYIEETLEDDSFYEEDTESVCIGTLDLSEVFEDYEEFAKHFTGEIGKA
jgi:hypothetical protein